MVRLARPGDKDAVFSIAETAIGDRAENGAVLVWPLSNPDLLVEGMVREISPVADPTTRTYTVKVTLKDPPPQVRFGMSIGGRWKGSPLPVVALPLSALFEKNGAPAVWVFDQASGSVVLKPVTVARYEADTVIIADGIATGDIVVTAGINMLRENQKVRLAAPASMASEPMSNFNLSRWALEHKSFVVYLMLITALAGILQYYKLGREEDPPFTIKTMVVKTLWPGATTLETVQQVTERIEKKLEELPNLDYLKSYTKPGESVVLVNLKDTTRAADVPDLWYQVRKKIGDIKQTLPREVLGPFFNDEFGDTYSLVLALTARRLWPPRAARLRRARARRAARAFPTPPRSTCSARRTRRSISSSRPSSLPPWGSTSRSCCRRCRRRTRSSRAARSMPTSRRSRCACRASSPRKRA